MKTIDLNFKPVNREGKPHVIDSSVAEFLQEILDRRISKERPDLEARVANDLRKNGVFEVSEEGDDLYYGLISDFTYMKEVVKQLDIDNLLKGQILDKF